MTPDGIRSLSHVLYVMGIAAAVGLLLQAHVWHLAGWVVAAAWILAAFAMDITAGQAERRHEREVARVRERLRYPD